MAELFLNDKVYFCIAQGQGVFLDLAQDAYTAVPLPAFSFEEGDRVGEAKLAEALAPHVNDLMAEGLLTFAQLNGPRFLDYRAIFLPQGNILHPYDGRAFGQPRAAGRNVRIGSHDVYDFFLASRRASELLRTQHICSTVEQVKARKAAARHDVMDTDTLRSQTAIFRRLRPWYPRPYVCLFDALALVEFLARRKLFPTWVFAVQAQPFGAHCWIQSGDLLLNEGIEYADQFTPIMAV